MSSVKYSFEKVVNAERLDLEVRSSAIITALDYISSSPSTVDLWFKATLSSGDETTLNTLVGSHINTPLPFPTQPTDTDNSPIVRPKTTKTGWHYDPRFLSFTTGKYQSLVNVLPGGVDMGDAWLKFYDNSGTLLTKGAEETAEDFQIRLNGSCVKTIMDWWPTYDWDVIGCLFKIKNVPATKDLLWVIAAPDIPANLGGSVYLCSGGVPLSFFAEKEMVYLNGRGSKSMTYNPLVPSTKLRVLIEHTAGSNSDILFAYEHFKG